MSFSHSLRCIQFSRTSRLGTYRVPRQAPSVHVPRTGYVPCICIPVCSIRTSVSLSPFYESKSLSRSSWVPQGHHPKHSRVLPLFSVSRILRAALHLAILSECHLHATFSLTCINIYSSFPASSRILRDRYIYNI